MPDGRLVSILYVGSECGQYDLQRGRNWIWNIRIPCHNTTGSIIRTTMLWIWCEWDVAIWSGLVKTLKQISYSDQNNWYISCHPNRARCSVTRNSDIPCSRVNYILKHITFYRIWNNVSYFQGNAWVSKKTRTPKQRLQWCLRRGTIK